MIQIPEKLAIQIEIQVDAAFEKAKEYFPLNDEMWDSFGTLKDEILNEFTLIHDFDMILSDPSLKNHFMTMCIKLGLIYRLERHINPEYGPLTIV